MSELIDNEIQIAPEHNKIIIIDLSHSFIFPLETERDAHDDYAETWREDK